MRPLGVLDAFGPVALDEGRRSSAVQALCKGRTKPGRLVLLTFAGHSPQRCVLLMNVTLKIVRSTPAVAGGCCSNRLSGEGLTGWVFQLA
jgi:hypothetical protein